MKHIRSINELFKKTYLSAADKFRERRHPSKADELELWATKRGTNEPFPQRQDPNRFYFNIPSLKSGFWYECFSKISKSRFNDLGPFAPPPPFFHITEYGLYNAYPNFWDANTSVVLNFSIIIEIINNFGDKLNIIALISLSVPRDSKRSEPVTEMYPSISLSMRKENEKSDFHFTNRKDAIKFKNFLVDIIDDLQFQAEKETFPNVVSQTHNLRTTYRNFKDKDGKHILGENEETVKIPFSIIKEIPLNKFYNETS